MRGKAPKGSILCILLDRPGRCLLGRCSLCDATHAHCDSVFEYYRRYGDAGRDL